MNGPDRRHIARELVEAGHRLDALGLVPSRDGNLSARIGRGRILVTPTFTRKRDLEVASLVEVDLEGAVHGPGQASTELGMHLAVYRAREDVHSVVHAHPPVAVGFASAGLGLTECLMPEVAVALGGVPLAPYATPGTPDLEASIAGVVADYDAFLLSNHGAVTLGASVAAAADRMETLEHFAKIALVTRLLGGGRPLHAGQVAELEAQRRRAGDPRPISCEPGPMPSPPVAACQGKPGADPGPGIDPEHLASVVTDVVRQLLGR